MKKIFFCLLLLGLIGVVQAQSLEEAHTTMQCWKIGNCSLGEALQAVDDWSNTPQTIEDVVYSIELWKTEVVDVGFVIRIVDAWRNETIPFNYQGHIDQLL